MKKKTEIVIVKNSGHQWDIKDANGKQLNDFPFLTATQAADWADEQGYQDVSPSRAWK